MRKLVAIILIATLPARQFVASLRYPFSWRTEPVTAQEGQCRISRCTTPTCGFGIRRG